MRRELGMFVALLLMGAGLWWSNPDFLGSSNVVNTSRQIGMLGIFAIGISFVIITGGIDLSIGSVIGLTGVMIAKMTLPGEYTAPATWVLGSLALLGVLIAGLAVAPNSIRAGATLLLAGCALKAVGCVGALIQFKAMTPPVIADAVMIVACAALLVVGLVVGSTSLFMTGAGLLVAHQYVVVAALALMGGQSLWVAIPVALVVAAGIGWAQGALITRLNLQPFIVTLGGMLALRGVSQTIVRGGTLSLGDNPLVNLANGGIVTTFFGPKWDPGHGALAALGRWIDVVPAPVVIFFLVVLIAGYVLHFTVFGRYVYAIGGNRDAAEYSGIPVKRVETLTYVISALSGGIAGVCYAAYIGQMSQQVGIAYELYAIAAAVLGGVSLRGGEGTIVGIIIGSCIMRVIDNGINMFQWVYRDADGIRRIWRLDNNWTFIIIGAVILVAVVLDQVVHILQAKRRTRKAAAVAMAATPSGASGPPRATPVA